MSLHEATAAQEKEERKVRVKESALLAFAQPWEACGADAGCESA